MHIIKMRLPPVESFIQALASSSLITIHRFHFTRLATLESYSATTIPAARATSRIPLSIVCRSAASSLVLRRVEYRKMLTDYFFGFITLDLLCALVPVGGVKHINCVAGKERRRALRSPSQLRLSMRAGPQKVKLWPTKSNNWPTITSTDLDTSLYGLVASADEL